MTCLLLIFEARKSAHLRMTPVDFARNYFAPSFAAAPSLAGTASGFFF
jgi:hypothetical protein